MDHRHHRASRDVQVIIVPVPCGGSPAPLHRGPPPAYPRQERAPWKPQRFIPAKQRKAEAIVKIMRELDRRAEDARQMLTPSPAGLKSPSTIMPGFDKAFAPSA
jgi:hypothetical protein